MTNRDEFFMRRAIQLAQEGMDTNSGGPFGCVIVKDNEIIAEGFNQVTSTNDATAHAEIIAIRKACQRLNSFHLEDCVLYTSCEPCPMCLGAIYWARLKTVFYACNKLDANKFNFSDQFIYEELDKPLEKREIQFRRLLRKEALPLFDQWKNKEDKKIY